MESEQLSLESRELTMPLLEDFGRLVDDDLIGIRRVWYSKAM
jgi:hypothetical protein